MLVTLYLQEAWSPPAALLRLHGRKQAAIVASLEIHTG